MSNILSVMQVLEELQANRSKYVTDYGVRHVPPHWIFQCFIEERDKILAEVSPTKITFGLYHDEEYNN